MQYAVHTSSAVRGPSYDGARSVLAVGGYTTAVAGSLAAAAAATTECLGSCWWIQPCLLTAVVAGGVAIR